MASSTMRMSVTEGVAAHASEFGLSIQTASGSLIATIDRADASLDDYHRALTGIRDAIDRQLGVSAPKPEPIKVGDWVALHGYDHKGKVREIHDKDMLFVTFDDNTWRWCSLASVTKVLA